MQRAPPSTSWPPWIHEINALVRDNPPLRDRFVAHTLSMWERQVLACVVLAHLNHVHRWPEVRAVLEVQLQANDWRSIPVLRSMLDAYNDGWQDRDLLPEIHGETAT